jgi:5-methyltetrahydropteroyltriglutamate--homocysteine methyltransferase
MKVHAPYATTVVGSYSVPLWYETLEREIETGRLPREQFTDAQFRATQAAVKDQELAGIDIITGGEMHRRTNNRHAPPNAMLNHFWEKLPGFSKETRPKPITPKDPDVFHPAAVCTGPIEYADLGLVEEFRTVSALTDREVKITMTGPHMLAKVAHDEHYGDIGRMMIDLAAVMNRNFLDLEAAGCRCIQIDEPLFAVSSDEEVAAAVEAINAAVGGLRNVTVHTHICQGNYAVGDYDGRIGHRYFDTGRYPAELICAIRCDVLLVEYDFVDAYKEMLGDKTLAVGAADVQDRNVETGETIAGRIRQHDWLDPRQTMITSSCGLNHLDRATAFGKLKAMAEAGRILRSTL